MSATKQDQNGSPYRVPPEPNRWPSIGLAVGVHALLLTFLWIGVSWQNNTPVAVEAEVWDMQTQTAAPPPPPPTPAPEPEPQPEPEPAPAPPTPTPAPPPPMPRAVEPPVEKPQPKAPDIALEREKKRKEELKRKEEQRQEEARLERERQAEQKRADDKRLEQKRIEQQREDDRKARALAEKKEQAEQEKRALEEKKAEQAKKEKAEKAAKEKAEKEKAEKAEKAAKEKAEKAAKEKAENAKVAKLRDEEMKRLMAGAGNAGSSGTAAQSSAPRIDKGYTAAITAKVKGNTSYAGDTDEPGNPTAVFRVEQLPTGEIISVRKTKSSGVPAFDDAVEKGITKSSPLPKKKDGTVERSIVIEFRMKDLQ